MQRSPLALALFLAGASVAHGQLVAPAGAASAPTEDPMERAKRQANNVMRWIKVHADKPRASTAKEAAVPAPTPVARPAPRTAPAPGYASAPESEKSVAAAAPAPQPTPQAPPPVDVPLAPPPSAAAAPAIAKTPPPQPPIVEEEDTPLKALSQPQPVIPRNTLSTIDAGKVMVRFMVETNGSVSNVEVLSSSSRLLNKPTVAAISNWRFEPVKAPRPAQIEIVFNL